MSSNAGLSSRLRLRSHQTSVAIATAPTAMSAPTASPPSCHTRMPSTMPPMPTAESAAPVQSTPRSPVYGTSFTSPMFNSTTAITASSSRKPTRHDR
jgi:hypothetical protein